MISQALRGKVAVVTGASGGIGRSIAGALGGMGAAVVVHYHRDRRSANAVVADLQKQGADALAVSADVRKPTDVRRLFQATLRRFGRVDILVNNAGVTCGSELADITPGEWDEVLDTNVKGVFLCCQVFGAWMFEHGGGRIVNIASTAGLSPLPGAHHYVASKAAVIGMTRSLALSLAPRVMVNSIAPGFVDSGPTAGARAMARKLIPRIPLGRLGDCQDVAEAVGYLAVSRYVTGQTLIVDGGISISSRRL